MKLIDVQNVSKVFQYKTVVNDISLHIKPGEIVALLGPNGAGKTTTISMILGLLTPTEGTISIFGQKPGDLTARQKIGVMLQELSVLDGLKVGEVIDLFRNYYPHPLSKEELLSLSGLTDEVKKRTEKLSGGQKRRLSFALAIAGDPDVLFFDEPTVGMDTQSRRQLWNTVKSFVNKGKSLIFSTHYLQEADDMADRIILLKEGTVVAEGTPDDIKAMLTTQTVSFVLEDTSHITELREHPHIIGMYENRGRTFVETTNTDAVLSFIFTQGLKVKNVQTDQGKLDDAFEALTVSTKEDV
ncbi:ABC transporter ATP-binding protein [Salipaludibacillus agaradhaerens]|uniref:ABC transporter ATP-binding protein n=1 Tax=Salipaludibacillus agaradhaerens TaxID=76935 RepID=UPI0021508FF4|nr:ABC transporter ATP-binding protein [Salipaludibacillus agaradhaerens]MCR6105617.1 ABC transporter ATP-binding protein [Salipaludibacillus agaradhaerens]MCR6117654.1 ABC transporter ATP-binding protein [Salipaludibacillus agaradhaerens]